MPSSSPNTQQLALISYLDGLNPDGTLASQSFWDWQQTTPATYDPSMVEAHKWDNDPAGVTRAATSAAGTPGGVVTYAFSSGFTPVQEAAFVAALTLWSDEANITFAPAVSSAAADVVFKLNLGQGTSETSPLQASAAAGQTAIPSSLTPTDGGNQAVITFDTSGTYGTLGSFTASGGYSYSALIHEVGHLLGLGHSGPYDEGVTGDPTAQQNGPYDSRQWSAMSYIQPDDAAAPYALQYQYPNADWALVTPTANGGETISELAPKTPMPLDILAAQQLYGAPTHTALSGGQVFGFGCNITDASRIFFDFTVDTTPVVTLWDAGGGNTLNLSGYSQGSTVDLNPGTFSSADGLVDNIGIAFGTAIDTAIGGPGNDSFTVNGDSDTIIGGGGTDTVDFAGPLAAYSFGGTPTALTVSDGTVTDMLEGIAYLAFADQSAPIATDSVTCYCAGTAITTPGGDVPIERLAPGDAVLTASGEARPIVWIGRRSYGARFAARSPAIRPILFRRGSLGAGLPRRDLRVSPEHAMLLDGALVAARELTNGTTILPDPAPGDVHYLHIELASHDVILAEGAWSETFLDDDSRNLFANAADWRQPDGMAAAPGRCAPRLESGPALEAIRQRLQSPRRDEAA